jgi:outer membrane immunogenic protein
MKSAIIVVASAAALIAAPAIAADMTLPVKAPPVVPAPAASGWTGFYLGADAGLSATNSNWSTTNFVTQVFGRSGSPIIGVSPITASRAPVNMQSARLGGYLGYNWQFAPRWLVGIEGDLGWTGHKATLLGFGFLGEGINGFPNGADLSLRTTWDASARLRLGYLVTPTALIYATGGFAWQHQEATFAGSCPAICNGATGNFIPFLFTTATNRPGATVGGGMEVKLAPNWVGRAEYRYTAYKSFSATGTEMFPMSPRVLATLTPTYKVDLQNSLFTLGLAYQFGPAAPTPDSNPSPMFVKARALAAPPPVSWTGFYAGLDAGFRATRADLTTTSATSAGAPVNLAAGPASDPLDGIAPQFGLHAGYDRQFATRWVAGSEASVGLGSQTTNLNGVEFTPGVAPLSVNLQGDNFAIRTGWDGSARARLGFLVTPSALVYATGGAAWQHYNVTSTCAPFLTGGACSFLFGSPGVITVSDTKVGYTIGGGIETQLVGNWFGRGEYRYADFGTGSFQLARTGPPAVVDNFNIRLRTHTALLGFSYKLGAAAQP